MAGKGQRQTETRSGGQDPAICPGAASREQWQPEQVGEERPVRHGAPASARRAIHGPVGCQPARRAGGTGAGRAAGISLPRRYDGDGESDLDAPPNATRGTSSPAPEALASPPGLAELRHATTGKRVKEGGYGKLPGRNVHHRTRPGNVVSQLADHRGARSGLFEHLAPEGDLAHGRTPLPPSRGCQVRELPRYTAVCRTGTLTGHGFCYPSSGEGDRPPPQALGSAARKHGDTSRIRLASCTHHASRLAGLGRAPCELGVVGSVHTACILDGGRAPRRIVAYVSPRRNTDVAGNAHGTNKSRWRGEVATCAQKPESICTRGPSPGGPGRRRRVLPVPLRMSIACP